MATIPVWGPVEDSLYGAGSALQQFATGVGQGVKTLVCRVYNGWPGWATGPKVLTAFGRGFMDSACRLPNGQGPLPNPALPMIGGQCAGVSYIVYGRYRATGGKAPAQCGIIREWRTRLGVVGPISQSSLRKDTGEPFQVRGSTGIDRDCYVWPDTGQTVQITGSDCDTTVSATNVTRPGLIWIDGAFRADGQPDTCGDPPPTYPPTPPPEGDKYYDFDIPIIIGPNTFSIPISLGPISVPISPEFSFAPTFIIPIGRRGDRPEDRIPLVVTPDGIEADLDEVLRRLQENQDQLQRNNSDIQQAIENITEVAGCVCVDLDRTVKGYSCDPEAVPLEVAVAGRGIAGVFNFLDAINAQNNEQTRQLCPGADNPPKQVPPIRMANGTMSFENRVVIVPVGPDVISIALVILGYDNKLLSVVSVDNNHGVDAKFGSLSWGLYREGLIGGGTLELVYQRSTYIRMGRHLKQRAIRIALKPGVSWELYDTGERENG